MEPPYVSSETRVGVPDRSTQRSVPTRTARSRALGARSVLTLSYRGHQAEDDRQEDEGAPSPGKQPGPRGIPFGSISEAPDSPFTSGGTWIYGQYGLSPQQFAPGGVIPKASTIGSQGLLAVKIRLTGGAQPRTCRSAPGGPWPSTRTRASRSASSPRWRSG